MGVLILALRRQSTVDADGANIRRNVQRLYPIISLVESGASAPPPSAMRGILEMLTKCLSRSSLNEKTNRDADIQYNIRRTMASAISCRTRASQPSRPVVSRVVKIGFRGHAYRPRGVARKRKRQQLHG